MKTDKPFKVYVTARVNVRGDLICSGYVNRYGSVEDEPNVNIVNVEAPTGYEAKKKAIATLKKRFEQDPKSVNL